MVSLGVLLGYSCGLFASSQIVNPYLQCLFVFSGSLIILIAQMVWVLLIFPYETPKYLLSKGRIEDTKNLISIIYKEEYLEVILR